MASASTRDVGRDLGRLFGAGSAVGLTDGALLERFAQRRDDTAQAAFETILARHGALVLTVCRQVLGDAHAAEDAFQATFLVLVRRAGSLRVRAPGSLGPWLHGVAYRIALKARQGAARRRARERRIATREARQSAVAFEHVEHAALLHEEVNRLPMKYRAPVVMCYFEGRTHDEAAAALRWPVGTVRGRLARARDRLRTRLTRRGLALGGFAAPSFLQQAARIVPSAPLVDATIAALNGLPGATAQAMANLVLRTALAPSLKLAASVITIMFTMAGFSLVLRGERASQPPEHSDRAPAPALTARPRPRFTDRQGDPLPQLARARMGTNRFHDGAPLKQALYTLDAKSLVTVNTAHVVRVWDAMTGQIVREIGNSQGDLRVISYSPGIALAPDGKMLAIIEQPGRLVLWDVTSGRERRQWHQGRDERYEHPIFSPDGRTLAVSVNRFDAAAQKFESFIDLWDTAAPTEQRRRIPGDWVRLWDLAFSPDGKILAMAGRDAEIVRGNTLIGPERGSTRLWEAATGRELRRFPVERLDVQALAFSPDGKLLANAVSDGTIRFHEINTGHERMPRLVAEPALPPGGDANAAPSPPRAIARLAFSPDGTVLAGGDAHDQDSSVASIHLWDVARGEELHRISAHRQLVASLSFAPDGKTLATTGAAEPVVRLWNVATGRDAFPQSGHHSAIRQVVASPADGTVFTGGIDGTVRRWSSASGQELGVIARLDSPVESLAVAPDGKTLFVGGQIATGPQQEEGLGLWSVAEHRQIRRLAGLSDGEVVHYVAYSPDAKTVASAGRVWDAATGKNLITLRHKDPRNDRFLSFCPMFYTSDSDRIITAEPDGVRVWDIATGREVRRAIAWSNHHDHATLSPDGRFMATRGPGRGSREKSNDPPVIIWELSSGQPVHTLAVRGEDIRFGPFSPGGRFLATAGFSETRHSANVVVWDLATGREVRRFEGHRGRVNDMAFTPDGRSLISGSDDATALVWDVSELWDNSKSRIGVGPTPMVLESRWVELAGDAAGVAYRATWDLSVPSAVAFLRDHLRAAEPGGPAAPLESLRRSRAIAALERVGTPEARAVLERMAQGDREAIETQDAKSALNRLSRPKA